MRPTAGSLRNAPSRDMLAPVRTFRIAFIVALAVIAMAACSSGSDSATSTVTPSVAPSVEPGSPSPTATVVNDCTIEPDAQCPGAYLSLVSLQGMDLSGANLEGADLHASDLRRTDLTGANLTDADITDSDLSDATLVGADLTGAKLRHANLTGTDFTGAEVSTRQLGSAYLCDTVMPDGGKNDSGCKIPTEAPSSGVSPSPSGPVITSFIAPEGAPPCPSSPPDASVTVKIKYKTTGAQNVSWLLDGVSVNGTFKASGGTAELDFSCDKPSHKYTLIASDGGKKVKESATVYRT